MSSCVNLFLYNFVKYTIYIFLDDKIAIDKKVKDLSPQNLHSEDKKKSGPHIVSNHPSGNLVISIGTKVESKSSTNKKQFLEDSETEVKQQAKYQKTNNAMSIVKTEDNQSSNTLILIEEPNLNCSENKSVTIKTSEYYSLFSMIGIIIIFYY